MSQAVCRANGVFAALPVAGLLMLIAREGLREMGLATLILGGLAGVAVTARLYWHQLLAFFGLRRKRSATEADKTQSPE